MTHDHTLEKRNWLLIRLYFFSSVLGTIILIVGGNAASSVITVALIGLTATAVMFLMHKFRLYIHFIPYLIILSLGGMVFTLIHFKPAVSSYLLTYYSLVIASLYHNYKYMIGAGFIGLLATNYFLIFHGEQAIAGFDTSFYTSVNLLYVLIAGLLITQTILGSTMQKKSEALANEALKSKEEIEGMLEKVSYTADTLDELNEELQEHANTTSQFSNELTITFNEIAGGVESQADSASEMSSSVTAIDDEVKVISDGAGLMYKYAEETNSFVQQGAQKVQALQEKMAQVNSIMKDTAVEMNELREATSKVGDILETISDIADQTNLLALNAAIEAARAGESGRGFAVVAQEVRKLAEYSLKSTREITPILSSIQTKARSASERVSEGEVTFQISEQITRDTGTAFKVIEGNANEVKEQSREMEGKLASLNSSSREVVDEINSVSSVTEELSASVEEVLASVEEQNARILSMTEKVNEIDKLSGELKGQLLKKS
ncbi:methyl-accepting chemotaxis protein [Evansella clarkii]|uniref:methyl-accepting chemotaxis protein n=1 Tax=Evansella clarkii TaxID=79879 RepID=UPI000B42F71F|nr:methyl-accepting chemotaxis protein [Evansella clarkii]